MAQINCLHIPPLLNYANFLDHIAAHVARCSPLQDNLADCLEDMRDVRIPPCSTDYSVRLEMPSTPVEYAKLIEAREKPKQ